MFLVQINLTDNICGVRTRWEILLVWCVAVVSPDHQLGQGWPGPPSPAQPSPAQPSPVLQFSGQCPSAGRRQPGPAKPSPAQPRVPCSAAPPPARAGGEMLGGDVDAGHQCTGHLTVTFIPLCSALASHSAHTLIANLNTHYLYVLYLYNLFYYLSISILYLFLVS